MSTVVTVLAALFAVVAIIRLPSAIRSREARASYLTVVFAAPGLLLLNTNLVHYLITELPWAAGPIRVAPFLFAVLALWSLGEAAAQAVSEGRTRRGSLMEPLIWCAAIVAIFLFVDLDPRREIFTIVHATQFAGRAYTLVYYTAAAGFAGRIPYRILRSGRRGLAYYILGTGGALIAVGCAFQYVLLVPVYLRSPLPDSFYLVFDVLFFPGALLIVIALQMFAFARRSRRIWMNRRVRQLAAILRRRKLPSVELPDAARKGDQAYAVFAHLVHIDDYSVRKQLDLTDAERNHVESARRWVSRTLPTLTNVHDYTATD